MFAHVARASIANFRLRSACVARKVVCVLRFGQPVPAHLVGRTSEFPYRSATGRSNAQQSVTASLLITPPPLSRRPIHPIPLLPNSDGATPGFAKDRSIRGETKTLTLREQTGVYIGLMARPMISFQGDIQVHRSFPRFGTRSDGPSRQIFIPPPPSPPFPPRFFRRADRHQLLRRPAPLTLTSIPTRGYG